MKNPLLDQAFLEQLFLYNHKEVYAKIILLSFDEYPIKEIQGMITAGSVNVDGNSAVRRTCSLTMVTEEGYISDAHWGLRNKFKLEVGLKNFIDSNYPDIIWFKQGIYVITSLNENFATNSHQITIQGKDKMCLLNGEVGGNLIASTDFGKLETYDEDKSGNIIIEYEYLKIKDIIKYAVGTFGMELPHNIIINDVEDYGKELLEYRGDIPLYLFKNYNQAEINQMFFETKTDYAQEIIEQYKKYNGSEQDFWEQEHIIGLIVKRDFKVDERITDYQALINKSNSESEKIVYGFLRQHKLNKKESKNYDDNGNFIFDVTIPELTVEKNAPTMISADGGYRYYYDREEIEDNENDCFTVIKAQYGDTVGYRQTDLTYPGDLIANIGESLTSILDKIKQMFNDYEYFYDLDGRFVFQTKKTYINNSWNSLTKDQHTKEIYANSAAYSSAVSWRFEDNMLLTAFTNNPNIQNLKNDFAVWGEKQSISGEKLPVHIRYAVQEKPIYYYSNTENKYYITEEYSQESILNDLISKDDMCYKFRNSVSSEIIYYPEYKDYTQVLLDNYKEHSLENGSVKIALYNDLDPLDILVKRDFKVREENIDYQEKINECIRNNDEIGEMVYTYLRQHKLKKIESNNYDDNGNFIFDKSNKGTRFYYGYNENNKKVKRFSPIYERINNNDSELYWANYYNSYTNKDINENEFYDNIYAYRIYSTENQEKGAIEIVDSDYAQQLLNKITNYVEGEDGQITELILSSGNVDDILLKRDLKVDETKTDYQSLINAETDNFKIAVYKYLRQHKLKKINGNNYNADGNFIFGQTQALYNSNKEQFTKIIYNKGEIEEDNEYAVTVYKKVSSDMRRMVVDWREIIYQMAIDYYNNTQDIREIIVDNGENAKYYPQGITGYEMFYIDLQGFWRQLYNPIAMFQEGMETSIPIPGSVSNGIYYTDTCWSKAVTEQPETLNFWFDFISTDSELGKYSISTIGDRTKVVNDNKVSGIYFKETPTILFSFNNSNSTIADLRQNNPGYTIMKVSNSYSQYFSISAQGKSAQSALTGLLNQHAFTIDSTTITSIPIYHLQPNTRIFVKDDNTKINGEYIVSKITIPLTHNGTMSITATKAVENIY